MDEQNVRVSEQFLKMIVEEINYLMFQQFSLP